jgi:excisionase family DNA binding protein
MLQCGLVCRHRSKAPRSIKYQLNFSAQETVMQHLNVIPRGQLCEQIGVSRSTIKRWIQTRNFPQPLKASGREPLFNRDAVDQWFSELEAKND